MRRYLGYGTAELEGCDLGYVNIMLRKHRDDQMRDDVFRMQIQGCDPMKVPLYAKWLNGIESSRKEIKAHLSEDDAQAYKNVFTKVLKGVKRGK